MNGASRLWARLRATFWFLPALIVLLSMLLAVLLVELDAARQADLAQWSRRLFGASAEGSRSMLSAIATSMVTVAGVVFSITIVALSLTSTQYSPRVLRNFMRDAPTQVVLGAFVGIFAYCLLVLRTIRGGDEGTFIPSLAVIGGIGYALLGIGVLIYFIHHVALSIQAASILDRVAADTARAIDLLFPQELGEPPAAEDRSTVELPTAWAAVPAVRSGYVQSVDVTRLLRLAGEADCVVRLCCPVGTYVSSGDTLLEVASGLRPGAHQALRRCVVVAGQRTVEQDAAFGIQQVVEVAVRALSPGINDPGTARMCVNVLGTLLGQLAGREIPPPLRFVDGRLRVIAPTLDFGETVEAALRPVVRYGGSDPDVLASAIRALESASARAKQGHRQRTLLAATRHLQHAVARVRPRSDGAGLRADLRQLQERLRSRARALRANPP